MSSFESEILLILIIIAIAAFLLYGPLLLFVRYLIQTKKIALINSVRLKAVVDNAAEGIVTFNETGLIEAFNPKAADMFGYSEQEILGKNFKTLVPGSIDQTGNFSFTINQLNNELSGLTKDKQTFPLELTVTEMHVGKQHLYLGMLRDISRRKLTEAKLLESENRFHSAFDFAATGMALVSLEGRWMQVNSALTRILGFTREELLKMDIQSLTYEEDQEISSTKRDQLLRDEIKFIQMEKRFRHKDGQIIWTLDNKSLIRDAEGNPLYFVVQLQDITKQKKAEEQLTYKAYYDSLTGLLNRNQLEYNIDQLIKSVQRHHQTFAVFFLDLDNFKLINDSLGHDAGDRLLEIVASRLKNTSRVSDVVGRLGGDEFILVLKELRNLESAALFAEKIIDNLSKPILIKGHELFVTTSIGIAFYPSDGQDYQTLIKNADSALYRAKEKGRNNYQFCTFEMSAKIQEKIAFESALKQALENKEFQLFYQPIIDFKKKNVVAVEALLRWQSHEYGMIAPQQIIPFVEETGLIIPLGDWILETACRQMKIWQHQHQQTTLLKLGINLSARQFLFEGLVSSLISILKKTGFNPNQLELEIKENLIMQDPELSMNILRELKNQGIKIAIDDFGTGYSSLSYLQRFSVDRIKIDRSLIQYIPEDDTSSSLVIAMIGLAKNLNIDVVAEGVERKEQYDFLKKYGCQKIQGFYICPPVSVDEATQFLEEFESRFMTFE